MSWGKGFFEQWEHLDQTGFAGEVYDAHSNRRWKWDDERKEWVEITDEQ